MRLFRLTVLLLLATIVVVEPVVHSHPLLPDGSDGAGLKSPNVCAICAVGGDTVVTPHATLVAPAIVIERVTVALPHATSAEARITVASRAPPAA